KDDQAGRNHPLLYSFFMPNNTYYSGGQQPKGRHFPISSMEAILRYGDTNSPSLTADPFYLLQQLSSGTLTPQQIRYALRLLTTHAYDLDQAGKGDSAGAGQLSPGLPRFNPPRTRFGNEEQEQTGQMQLPKTYYPSVSPTQTTQAMAAMPG